MASTNYTILMYYTYLIESNGKGNLTMDILTIDPSGGDGYMEFTFDTPVPDNKKSLLVCYLMMILNYPLEKYFFFK